MSTFVIVHGGFGGAWEWTPVARGLRARDHEVFTPTLTGMGERAHLVLIAAELNAVRSLGLWPRSLTGSLTEADKAALGNSARSVRRDPRERIAVSWVEDESDS